MHFLAQPPLPRGDSFSWNLLKVDVGSTRYFNVRISWFVNIRCRGRIHESGQTSERTWKSWMVRFNFRWYSPSSRKAFNDPPSRYVGYAAQRGLLWESGFREEIFLEGSSGVATIIHDGYLENVRLASKLKVPRTETVRTCVNEGGTMEGGERGGEGSTAGVNTGT